jgi:hypothetical protein
MAGAKLSNRTAIEIGERIAGTFFQKLYQVVSRKIDYA